MRKCFLFGCFLLAGIATAHAADLPVKARGPAAAPAGQWTGFYIGGQFGYGLAGVRPDNADVVALFGPGLTISDPEPAHGVLGGGTLGYNYQFGRWVTGLEADLSWSDVKGSFDGAVPGPVTAHVDARLNWLATARGRLGYTFGPALIYATAGGALARISGSDTNVTPGGTFFSTDANTHIGWTAGGGVEYAITRQMSAKVEGLYVGLSNELYQAVHFRGEVGVVRGGLNWRF